MRENKRFAWQRKHQVRKPAEGVEKVVGEQQRQCMSSKDSGHIRHVLRQRMYMKSGLQTEMGRKLEKGNCVRGGERKLTVKICTERKGVDISERENMYR